jgi:formate dehydrogenase accessory protein FdhD
VSPDAKGALNNLDAALQNDWLPSPTSSIMAHRLVMIPGELPTDSDLAEKIEIVAEEIPIALVYNGISHAVMLGSPQDLEDFAIGFTLSEQIVRTRAEIYDIEVKGHQQGIELHIHIAARAMAQLKEVRRHRTGKTGCGLCGTESLEQFDMSAPSVSAPQDLIVIDTAALHSAMADLYKHQILHVATGATHAAGWASLDGVLQIVREDVGRHNALDKLIGAMHRAAIPSGDGFAVISSRASFEMVQKSAYAGITLLAAVSAPTAMAIRMAFAAGITLAGFVRANQHTIYTHPQRLRRKPTDCFAQ